VDIFPALIRTQITQTKSKPFNKTTARYAALCFLENV